MKNKYKLTVLTCYLAYIVQAIVNNLLPLLYAQFTLEFGFTTFQISFLILINFTIQILMDTFSASMTLKIGQKNAAILSSILSALGLILLVFLPYSLPSFVGIIIPMIIMAAGGGFIEVIISPIIEAVPKENQSGSMTLLHSFYCWGHLLTILISVLFFNIFDISLWRFLPLVLIIVPITTLILFIISPIATLEEDNNPSSYKVIFSNKLLYVYLILMICTGASELIMAQWTSYYVEIALGVEKELGDLIGICLFAVAMALSRTLYGIFGGDKTKGMTSLLISSICLTVSYICLAIFNTSVLSVICIALVGASVGILWPGIYSLAAKDLKSGGSKIFGLMALGGDIGCLIGPLLIGLISEDIKIGISFAFLFPLLFVVCLVILILIKKKAIKE